MKIWKCNYCGAEKFSEEKIIFKICYVCQQGMIDIKKKVEDEKKI